MSRKNEESNKFWGKINEPILKIMSFLPLGFYCGVYVLQPFLNDQDEILSYIFTIFSCLFTFSFEIVEWYKLKNKTKENSVLDSTMRNGSFPFVLTGALFTVFVLIYVNMLGGKFNCLKNLNITTDQISSFVLFIYVCSCFVRNCNSKKEVTNEMNEMNESFYDTKSNDVKSKKCKKSKKSKKHKRSNKNKAYIGDKSQTKYKIYNEYNNCKVYYQQK